MKDILKLRITQFLLVVTILATLPFIWYNLPYQLREDYYRLRYGAKLYEPLLTIEDFDISTKGFSKTYDLKNNYVMPMSVGWVLKNLPDALPKYSKSNKGKQFDLNLSICIEIIVNGNPIVNTVSKDNITVSYSWSDYSALIYIAKVDYPLQARFSNNVKIRLEVLETDEHLLGGTGRLIIRPYPYR